MGDDVQIESLTAPCPSCGTQVSTQAAQCPACAHPIRHVMARKSRAVYILLGLFLGGFGVHNIYAGHSGKGIAQLFFALMFVTWLGWFTCGFGYLAWGAYILFDVLVTRKDGQGRPMV